LTRDKTQQARLAGTKVKRLKPLVDLEEEEDLDDSELGHDLFAVFYSASSKTKDKPSWQSLPVAAATVGVKAESLVLGNKIATAEPSRARTSKW